jgi:predicted permease
MKGNRGLMLLVIALIAGGLLVFYFTYFVKEGEKQPIFHISTPEKAWRSPEQGNEG